MTPRHSIETPVATDGRTKDEVVVASLQHHIWRLHKLALTLTPRRLAVEQQHSLVWILLCDQTMQRFARRFAVGRHKQNFPWWQMGDRRQQLTGDRGAVWCYQEAAGIRLWLKVVFDQENWCLVPAQDCR